MIVCHHFWDIDVLDMSYCTAKVAKFGGGMHILGGTRVCFFGYDIVYAYLSKLTNDWL